MFGIFFLGSQKSQDILYPFCTSFVPLFSSYLFRFLYRFNALFYSVKKLLCFTTLFLLFFCLFYSVGIFLYCSRIIVSKNCSFLLAKFSELLLFLCSFSFDFMINVYTFVLLVRTISIKNNTLFLCNFLQLLCRNMSCFCLVFVFF